MKNMKIPVENNLDEIVGEPPQLGEKYLVEVSVFEGVRTVVINQLDANNNLHPVQVIKTTISELKEM